MTTPLLRALTERHGLPMVDADSIDAFLTNPQAETVHSLLFFAGDPDQRTETHDVAAILPEILRAFGGRLRGALLAPQAEAELKGRFHVYVFPSLAICRGAEAVAVLPKIQDWSDYRAKIEAALDPAAPVLAASKGPKVEFTRSQGA